MLSLWGCSGAAEGNELDKPPLHQPIKRFTSFPHLATVINDLFAYYRRLSANRNATLYDNTAHGLLQAAICNCLALQL